MAFPLIPFLVLCVIVIFFALYRDLFIKTLIQLVIDLGFGILFAAAFYLIYRIPNAYILPMVLIVAAIFFTVSLFNRKSTNTYEKLMRAQQ